MLLTITESQSTEDGTITTKIEAPALLEFLRSLPLSRAFEPTPTDPNVTAKLEDIDKKLSLIEQNFFKFAVFFEAHDQTFQNEFARLHVKMNAFTEIRDTLKVLAEVAAKLKQFGPFRPTDPRTSRPPFPTNDPTTTSEYQDQPNTSPKPSSEPYHPFTPAEMSYNKWVYKVEEVLADHHGSYPKAREIMREQIPGYWVDQWTRGFTPYGAAKAYFPPVDELAPSTTVDHQGEIAVINPPVIVGPEGVVSVGQFIEQVKDVLFLKHCWTPSAIDNQDWSPARFADAMLQGLSPEQAAQKVFSF